MFNFKRKKGNDNSHKVDVNKPVENPRLKNAMSLFIKERNEQNALEFGIQLNKSVFLIPMVTDEMKTSKTDEGEIIERGSKIKFLNCFNDKQECFLPLFTDWEEIKVWTNENISSFIIQAKDAWEFALKQQDIYSGIVINPGTIGWSLFPKNLENLLEDLNKKQ